MSVTEAALEKKFLSVTNTQDSIQTLSLWLLHHKAHYKKIVDTWLKVLKKDKISHKLTLFYLANDVIQNCKRKNVSFFKDSFAEVLKDATVYMRDEQIKPSVERVFRIWNERNVYESSFITELQELLEEELQNSSDSEESRIIAEFKVEDVVEKIKIVKKLDMEVSNKGSAINFSKLDVANAEVIQKFKDRKHGQQFTRDFDENSTRLEEIITSSNKLKEERGDLITVLEKSQIYYENQRLEAKVVANAYKNFASRVKVIEKKLKEIVETFASPIPSPTVDAPSPTTSDAELNLPGEQNDDKSDVEQSQAPVGSTAQSAPMTEVGNPIPTVSNIFSQEPGGMTSWLDTFAKKESPVLTSTTTSTSQNNSVSLDSRLSSLLQNIPSLTSGLPNTLFNSNLPLSSSDSIPNSPAAADKNNNAFHSSEINTPMKEDEYSGQNTPLQDEETPSNPSSFFSRLAATPKASQSPKEILKGLKNFIQNASSMPIEKSLNLHDDNLSWSFDKTDVPTKQNTAISNKSASAFSDLSRNLTPISAFQSSQCHNSPSTNISMLSSSTNTSSSQIPFLNTPSYTTTTHSPETSIAQSIDKNLSFIPTLVPSTPTVTSFNFPPEDTYCPYSPTHENFTTDMDIDSNCDESSPTPSIGTPDISEDKMEEHLSLPRQSTLITLVTNNNPMEQNETTLPFAETKRNFSGNKELLSVPETNSVSSAEVVPFLESSQIPKSDQTSICLSDSSYTSADYAPPVENIYSQATWPSTVSQPDSHLPPLSNTVQKPFMSPVTCQDEESLNEAYFLTSPPHTAENDFLNGQSKSDTDLRIRPPFQDVSSIPPPLKIETIDSHRTLSEDDTWRTDDWNNNFEYTEDKYHDRKSFHGLGPHRRGDHHRQFDGPRHRFPPRNSRPYSYGPRPRINFQSGTQPRRFRPPPPFSQRDTGWNRHARPRY